MRYKNNVIRNLAKLIDDNYRSQSAFIDALNNGKEEDVITLSDFNRFMNGKGSKKGLGIDQLGQIADFLGVPISELFSDESLNYDRRITWSDIYQLVFEVARQRPYTFQVISEKDTGLYGISFLDDDWNDNIHVWSDLRELVQSRKHFSDLLDKEEADILKKNRHPLKPNMEIKVVFDPRNSEDSSESDPE